MSKFGANVFITGANRGIGLGFVRNLVKENDVQKIFAGCREPQKAESLQQLQKLHPNKLYVTQIDVQNDNSVENAYAEIKYALKENGLNILINNAGILETNGASYENVNRQSFLKTFDANTVGTIFTTKTFYPLLKKAAENGDRAIVANISSGLGSSTNVTSRFALSHTGQEGDNYNIVYGMSKAAMNHFTKIFGSEEAKNGIIAVAFCPGWVQTDMGGQSAHLSVDESVGQLMKAIRNLKIEDSGRYIDRFGKTIPY